MSDQQPPDDTPPVAPGAGDPAGAAPPPPPPAWGTAAYPPMGGRPLHKPGTVPLRPLTLGDFFDGAFSTVRRHPRSTIGVGAVVTAAFMAVPIVVSLLLGLSGGLDGAISPDAAGTGEFGTGVLPVVSVVSSIFGLLANAVVTGLVVPVVTRAAIGEDVSPSAAWARVRGRLPALIGLAVLELVLAVLLIGVLAGAGAGAGYLIGGVAGAIVLGVLLLLVGFAASLAMHVKWFQLAAPSLVVERRTVLGAIARGGRLSGGSFWRILGIVVLTAILTGVIGEILRLPFSLLGTFAGLALPGVGGPLALLLASDLAAVVSGAVVAPFIATVAVLQYLDQRFRREGFDIDLITHVQQRAEQSARPGAR